MNQSSIVGDKQVSTMQQAADDNATTGKILKGTVVYTIFSGEGVKMRFRQLE